jgi:hypothetical protein
MGDWNVGNLMVICYSYNECRHALVKFIIFDELHFNFIKG